MSKKKTITTLAAALVLLPGLLTACASGSDPEGESSATNGQAGAAAQGAGLTSCLREQGYDLPDQSSGSGTMTLAAPDGVDQEQWMTDLKACLDADGGAGAAFKPAEPVGDPEQLRQVAQCIRDEGFADYPDDEQGQMAYQASDEQALQEASMRCFDEVIGAAGGAGSAR